MKGKKNMKRTYNNVALETVLFTISGLQKIRVQDRETVYDENPKVIFNGKACDFYSYRYAREKRSMVHQIEIDKDVLVFTLQTKYEEY